MPWVFKLSKTFLVSENAISKRNSHLSRSASILDVQVVRFFFQKRQINRPYLAIKPQLLKATKIDICRSTGDSGEISVALKVRRTC